MSHPNEPHPLERSIYLQAAELESPFERVAFLDQACDGDDHLRERVELLLNFSEPESFGVAFHHPDQLLDEDATIPVTGGRTMPAPVAEENYRIGPELARGGMGSIREAEDRKLKRSVAVKIMHSHVGSDPSAQARFVREAEVLALLSHPNIVPVYDIVWEKGKPLFYTMKLVRGRTLQQIVNELREKNPETLTEYPLDHLLGIFLKVCDAIAFAHSCGIIHRDLKPENVMVGEFGEVLVMDWGIAKFLGTGDEISAETRDEHPDVAIDPGATLEGSVMGTPQYMSPEQAAGEIGKMDARSDIYSLGAILYAILTLRPPVEGANIYEVLERVQTGDLTPITEAGSTRQSGRTAEKGEVLEAAKIQPLPHVTGGRVPAALSAVAMKALSLSKADRYQEATAFSADVEKFQGGFATEAEQAGLGKQLMLLVKRNKGIFSTAAAAWLLITGLAVWFVLGLQAKEKETRKQAEIARNAEALALAKEAETSRALARSSLSLAEAALREGNGPAIQAALADVPEDLRDPTWRYLLRQSDSSITRIDDRERFLAGAAHPRVPHLFAVIGYNADISFLNVRSGERYFRFKADVPKGSRRFRIAISPDGERIAVGQKVELGGIVIHSTRNGGKISGWDAKPTSYLEFSPDGRSLLQSEHGSQRVNLWEVDSGRLRWSYESQSFGVMARFSDDGKTVYSRASSENCFLRIEDGSVLRRWKSDPAFTSALSPDETIAVAGSRDGAIFATDTREGRNLYQFRTDGKEIGEIVFTPRGRRFVSYANLGDARQAVRVFDARAGVALQTLLGGIGYSDDADIHPISGELMLCGHKPRVWSLDGARWTFNARSVNQRYSIAFAGRDDWVFCPSSSHEMALQYLEGQSPETIWTPETGSSYNLADVSADGKVVALARYLAKDSPIPLLRREGETLEQVGTFSPTRHVHSIRLSPSGRHLVANFYSANYFEHFNTSTGVKSTVHTRDEFRQMNDIAWIGEETLLGLMTGNNYRGNPGSEEHIVVWDAASGEIIRRVPSPTFMDALAIEPGGKRFAEAGNNKHVRIRDAATLKVLSDFRAHDDSITALAWHPKKPILATGSADLTIRLWNLETGERIDEFRGPLAAPLQLSFSPSGQRLGCASQDSNVRIWDPISLRDESEPPLAEDASLVDGDEWFGNTLQSSRAKLRIDSEGWMRPLDNVTPELMEAVATKWKRVGGGFVSPAATAAALPLPGDLSGTSYTVRVGLRKEGDPGVFHLTLPIGDGMVGFELHGKEEYAGLHMVDGKRVESSPGVVEGIQITDSERHDLELTVRLDGPSVTITTTLDDLPLYEWKGAKARLSRGELWAKSTPPGFLSLGAYREGWEVCDVKVKLLSREDAPYALSTSRYSDVEADGEGWADLLSALNPDFEWDFLGGIQVADGVLWNTKGDAAKLALPGDFSGSSYQVALKIRRLRMGNLFRIQLPVDDRHVRFQIDTLPADGYRTGLSDVDGEGVLTSPQGLKGQIIDDLEVHDLEISVRLLGEEVEIVSLLDGGILHEWKGKIASLEDNTRPGNWPSGAIGLTVHSDDWEISEIKAKISSSAGP